VLLTFGSAGIVGVAVVSDLWPIASSSQARMIWP